MEPTTEPITTDPPVSDPEHITSYADQLDILIASNDVLINRLEMVILLILFLSTLYVYSLFRRTRNNG